jgi:hydrogenase maturation factor
MVLNKPVRRIAIVGTGVISASWAAEFLAHSFDVIAMGSRRPRTAVSIRKRTFSASAGRKVVSFGIGFETTMAGNAMGVWKAMTKAMTRRNAFGSCVVPGRPSRVVVEHTGADLASSEAGQQ